MANYFPAFAGLLSGANPDEETPFGVPASDVRMAQAGLLGNIGATLLAAGQRISPADRARLLAQIGPQTAQFSTDIYNAAQRRYQQGMLQEAQATRDAERKFKEEELALRRGTAEIAQQEAKRAQELRDQQQQAMQKAQEMAISIATPTQIRQEPGGDWVTQAAPTETQVAMQLAQAGGPNAIPGVIQALTKDASFTIQTGRDGFLYKVFKDGSPAERVLTAQGTPLAAKVTAAELSPTQFKLLDEQQANIDSGQIALDNLSRAAELSKTATYGLGALQTAMYLDAIGRASQGQKDLIELNNQIQRNVLAQLRATFGGNPTEAEGKALREVEGSVNQSPDVRKTAIENAIKLAERRIKFAQARMENIRTGYSSGKAAKTDIDDLMEGFN